MQVFGRRWFPIVAIAALILAFALPASAAKYASVIVDAETGRVLHGINSDKPLPPASLTKMMTLYMLFEAVEQGRYQMSSPLSVSQKAATTAPSRLGVRPKTTITVDQAIQALVTRSANDVAVVIAENLGGTEAKFGTMMTDKARALGMRKSTFKNASGLPNKQQFSSARDMAILATRLRKDFPQHYHYFSQTEFAYGGTIIRTHNRLLLNYPGADGFKTGFTVASGFNLVASAQRDGKRLIGVVFGGNSASTRDAHMASLLDAGFSEMAGHTGMLAAAPLLEDFESAAPLPMLASADNITGVGDIDTDDAPRATRTAKPAKAAKAATLAAAPAPLIADPARQWGIQVGAYGARAKAAENAELAKARLLSSYPGVVVRIEKAAWKKGHLFRAQIVGLKQEDISSACIMAAIETKAGCKSVTLAAPKPAAPKPAARTARAKSATATR